MAKKSVVARHKKPKKYKTREYNRCEICGRPRAYFRDFHICRLCLRKLANEGKIPGIRKASW
ncbi:MAG TPA: type Z 30S ribosomal protein S14 [Spirochaetota bacterium]|nr:type Z 30S ribosomal protein S14 [Spirochaetota bacterium]HOM37927.1 type Z 30S ribosomal protein S14 [Spirochaetota bacterium]HPQ48731.1 type Z 30S ribosomal protein S14 [Spirochaetota bacterium]